MKNKYRKFPLKIKLTITSVIILTAICICLTISSIFAADILTEAIGTLPAAVTDNMDFASGSDSSSYASDSVAAQREFRTTAVFTMIGLVVLGSVLTYLFASKTLKPLEKLTQTVNNINVNNLGKNIPIPHTGDEVDRLAQSFNDMTTKLNASYQVQKNFSANAAHELRTPLASIQTQLDVFALKKDRGINEYESLFQSIGKSTERLTNLVNDLLSFTNDQEVDLSKSVDLRGMIEEIIFELEEKAESKNVYISLVGKGAVCGSDRLLQRVFFNLISNAIRYNVDGGSVEVAISDHKVTVADTGIGIPDEAKPNVFNTFFCVDKSRSRELGGSGLGLAIVKNIIEKHGGFVYVTDNMPQGSIFVVSFEKPSIQ